MWGGDESPCRGESIDPGNNLQKSSKYFKSGKPLITSVGLCLSVCLFVCVMCVCVCVCVIVCV